MTPLAALPVALPRLVRRARPGAGLAMTASFAPSLSPSDGSIANGLCNRAERLLGEAEPADPVVRRGGAAGWR